MSISVNSAQIADLTDSEIDDISGGGNAGEAFLVGAGAGGLAGGFIGAMPGAAVGALVGGGTAVLLYYL